MYYANFDSFDQTVNAATTFFVMVTYTDGTTDQSSPIPIESLPSVQADILACQETNGWFTMWDRHSRSLVTVPVFQIKSIRFVLSQS